MSQGNRAEEIFNVAEIYYFLINYISMISNLTFISLIHSVVKVYNSPLSLRSRTDRWVHVHLPVDKGFARFIDRNYRYRSVAINIPKDARWTPVFTMTAYSLQSGD